MKNVAWFVLAISSLIAMIGLAQHKPRDLTISPAEQMQWSGEIPDGRGETMSTLWGDPARGPHAALHRFPAGWSLPLHTHSATVRAVVVAGNFNIAGDDGVEKKLVPGSFILIPANTRYSDSCDGGCVLAIDASGKFDIHIAERRTATEMSH